MTLQPKWAPAPPLPARMTTFSKVITIPSGKFLPRVKMYVHELHANLPMLQPMLKHSTHDHVSNFFFFFPLPTALKSRVCCHVAFAEAFYT